MAMTTRIVPTPLDTTEITVPATFVKPMAGPKS
jgi:hypothetical protein